MSAGECGSEWCRAARTGRWDYTEVLIRSCFGTVNDILDYRTGNPVGGAAGAQRKVPIHTATTRKVP